MPQVLKKLNPALKTLSRLEYNLAHLDGWMDGRMATIEQDVQQSNFETTFRLSSCPGSIQRKEACRNSYAQLKDCCRLIMTVMIMMMTTTDDYASKCPVQNFVTIGSVGLLRNM